MSSKEQEVWALIARGLSNKQIARLLDISTHTVKNHLGSLYRKLNVTGRVPAALAYQRKDIS